MPATRGALRGWLAFGVVAVLITLAATPFVRPGTTITGARQVTASATRRATVPAPITPTPQVPDPAECDVGTWEPPLLPEPTGEPVDGTTPTPFALPDGERVDRSVSAAITDTVRVSIACRNAGDFLRAYALVSNRYLATIVGGGSGNEHGT